MISANSDCLRSSLRWCTDSELITASTGSGMDAGQAPAAVRSNST